MPPSAVSNSPGLAPRRAGERAALVPEQLALQQRLGQRGAVEPDERVVAPGRAAMDPLGEHLLADAGLAGDQHGDLAARDALDQAMKDDHRLVADDNRAARCSTVHRRAWSGELAWSRRHGRCKLVAIDRHEDHAELRDLSRWQRAALAGAERDRRDPGTVRAAGVLDDHGVGEVQPGVEPRHRLLVDNDIAVVGPADRQRSRRRNRMREEHALAEHADELRARLATRRRRIVGRLNGAHVELQSMHRAVTRMQLASLCGRVHMKCFGRGPQA